MLLRIVDSQNAPTNKNGIQVIFDNSENSFSYFVDDYSSPIGQNFRDALVWYFLEYPKGETGGIDKFSVIEKIVVYGQYLGDQLLGEDHELIKAIDYIEEHGYENLDIQIESSCVDFFYEPWEIMCLHESNYILSSAVKSFNRKFNFGTDEKALPELRYELKGLSSSYESKGRDIEPLGILYLIARPDWVTMSFSSSNCLNLSLDAMENGGIVSIDIQRSISLDFFEKKISERNKSIHILHYDGPVIFMNGNPHFVLNDKLSIDELVCVRKISKMLVDNGVGVICVDARGYFENSKTIPASKGLAKVAEVAQSQGLGNIVGMAEISNPWASWRCFETIYNQILNGFDLSAAVVEARKRLQAELEVSVMTVKPMVLHLWPLLVHYSMQSVTFFESPQRAGGSLLPQQNQSGHEKLYGYLSEMLPPLNFNVGDGQALEVIDLLTNSRDQEKGTHISVVGDSGIGKSHLAHVVSFFLARSQFIDFGFYFDFSENRFSASDILEMISPILGISANNIDEVKYKIKKCRTFIVIDGVSAERTSVNEKSLDDGLLHLLSELVSHGLLLMTLGETNLDFKKAALVEIEKAPLLLSEQKVLAANTLRQCKLTEVSLDQQGKALLENLRGNPWLTKKIMPLLHYFHPAELAQQVEKEIFGGANTSLEGCNHGERYKDSIIERFYQWQWNGLAPVWKNFLILCCEQRGLLLEMLTLAPGNKRDSSDDPQFEITKTLFDLLGENEADISAGLDILDKAGFLTRFPHGRFIDAKCLTFLSAKHSVLSLGEESQSKVTLLFSQLLCECLGKLSRHMLNNPNQHILRNLVINCRTWFSHMENLWIHQDFRRFIVTKNAFSSLLVQSNIEDVSLPWVLELLNKHTGNFVFSHAAQEANMTWLNLAINVLRLPQADESQGIKQGVDYWDCWYRTRSHSIKKDELIVFRQVSRFLEAFYDMNGQRAECVHICTKSSEIYTRYQAWSWLVEELKSLARYYIGLGENDNLIKVEEQIINDIPYIDAPPGFESQQLLDVLISRIAREEKRDTRTILSRLKSGNDAERLADVLEGLESELYYLEGDYVKALPRLCKRWQQAILSQDNTSIIQLKTRLINIETSLGSESFNTVFETEVPKDTIKPSYYKPH